jgi:hypothetical protein
VPGINLSGSSMSQTVDQGESMTQTLTITNTGTADLTWSIAEGSSVVEGGCGTPGDLDWVAVSPSGGTTSGGNSDEVSVVFGGAGVAPGDYIGELCVTSNAPGSPELVVELSLTVIQTEFKVYLPAVRRVDEANGNPAGWIPLGGLLLLPAAVYGWRRRRN